MRITQLLPALLRTVVPLVYGLLIQLGLGHYLPDETVTMVATVAILIAIYLVLRILERLQPKIGMLLGWAKQPQYADVVKGTVLDAQGEIGAATKDDLRELGDQLVEALEKRIVLSTQQTSAAASDAVHAAVVSAGGGKGPRA